ncbi:MAG: sigma-54-dependent Fis family transcriptional regulator [Nitrospirota bacterium]|nr:sigma-54-dependent Fis family transcriptional regulator [Nitrospirota bacterium]MDE3224276.1 sigma-54-dependent Fis family transcriptional regulator [Nitrospirota bacterium]
MKTKARILVVDDDRNHCEMLGEVLTRAGFLVELATNGEEAIAKGGIHEYGAVLSDMRMGALSGMDVLTFFRKTAPDTPVVLLTAFGSVEMAIRAMKEGAFDYLSKPVNLDELVLMATRAVEHSALVRENRHLRQTLNDRGRSSTIIGRSRAMLEVFKLVGKVTSSQASVLIQGESGTGKELIARAIHDNGVRASQRFVAINCSAIPDPLIESELFGHVKGAFTGAHFFRRGLLEEANGGTCFLDEVGDLSPAGQAKLLRVLQEREMRRVGSNEMVALNLRIISASRRNLKNLVLADHFREDLFYRLNTVIIDVPSLHERTEDIPILAEYFLARFGGNREPPVTRLAPKAMKSLLRYPWPGNVRELEHVIERAVTLASHTVLSVDDLPPEVREAPQPSSRPKGLLTQPESASLSERERAHVLAVLKSANGNRAIAAKQLGISRWALLRLLDRYLLRDHE